MSRYGRYGRVRGRMLERQPAVLLTDGYAELANAIILQAVKDYRQSLCMLKRRPDSSPWRKEKRSCERFFHSSWFSMLTDADPNMILDGLREEAAV